jgi:RNA polymerase sigma-70 factor (ECF subfamily)
MDDNAIIRRIQNGDADAFAGLVRKYHRNLLAFIYGIVEDGHLTEDIGQEVFLDVYKSLPHFDPDRGTPFLAWLYTVARNRCISELRNRRRTEIVPIEEFHHITAAEDTAEMKLLGREAHQVLISSLKQLPEPFRTTLIMSLRGDSLDAIAHHCGIPHATVKTRLFRAREKVKLLLKEYFGGAAYERRI